MTDNKKLNNSQSVSTDNVKNPPATPVKDNSVRTYYQNPIPVNNSSDKIRNDSVNPSHRPTESKSQTQTVMHMLDLMKTK